MTYLLFLLATLTISCDSSIKNKNLPINNALNDESMDSSSTTINDIIIDSAFLEEVKLAYKDHSLLTDYRDSSEAVQNEHEYYSKVPLKLNLNGDEYDDYLILYIDFHHVQGVFIDGYTGQKIGNSNSLLTEENLFFNRPYPDEDDKGLALSVVDVNCGDNQDELMILFSAGSPPGSEFSPCLYLDLFRYNKNTSRVELIFEEKIMDYYFQTNDASATKGTINYIDVLYLKPECLDEIHLQKGYPSNSYECSGNFCDYWEEAEILPFKDTDESIYKFNLETNKFVKIE